MIDYLTDEYDNTIIQLLNESLQSKDQLVQAQICGAELNAALKEAERDEAMYIDTIFQLLTDPGRPAQKEMEKTIQNLQEYLIEIQITYQMKINELFKCDKKSDGKQNQHGCSKSAESLIDETRQVLCEFMQLTIEDAQQKEEKMNELLLSLQEKEEECQKKAAKITDTLTKELANYRVNPGYVQRQTACISLKTKLQDLQIFLEEKECGTACRLGINVCSLLNAKRSFFKKAKISTTAQLVQMFFTEVEYNIQTVQTCPDLLINKCSQMFVACNKQREICTKLFQSKETIDTPEFPEVSNH